MVDLVTTGNLLLSGDMTDGDDILLLSGSDTLLLADPVKMPDRIELGAMRREDWNTQINTSDDGTECRNNRWGSSLRSYDVALPLMVRTDADYIALRALFALAEGSRYTFEFLDWSDDEPVQVRFDTPLRITGQTPDLDHIDTFSLVEVRDYPYEGPPLPFPVPEYIASGTHVAQTSSGSLAVPYPVGLLADDIAIAQLTVFDSLTGGGGWNTAAGWNLLDTGLENSNAERVHTLLWRRLDGSETGSQTFTTFGGMGTGSTDSCNGIMTIFRGCIASGDPYDMSDTTTAADDLTPNAPVLNSYGRNRLIANFWGFQFPGTNFTPGIDYTLQYDVLSTLGIDTGLRLTTTPALLPVTYPGETATVEDQAALGESCIGVMLKPPDPI